MKYPSFALQVISSLCILEVGGTVRSKKLAPITNCHDCVFQQTKCIKQCLATYDCTKNIVKEGFCPYGNSVSARNCPKISTLSSCNTDNDCAGSKKCCNNGCRRLCASPLPFPPPSVSASSYRPHRVLPRRKSSLRYRIWRPTHKPKKRNYPFRVPKTLTATTTTTEKPQQSSESFESSEEYEDSETASSEEQRYETYESSEEKK